MDKYESYIGCLSVVTSGAHIVDVDDPECLVCGRDPDVLGEPKRITNVQSG